MTTTEIENGTKEILESFLGQGISDNTSRTNTSEWDSLQHMQIVFALEEKFGLLFTEEEIPLLDSYGAVVRSLIKKNEA